MRTTEALIVHRTPRRFVSLALLGLLAVLIAGCSAPVRVQWQTESEMNTAGFNLFRGTSPDGPFDVRINDQLIPPADDPLTGKAYTYLDKTARPGVSYYYQLEEIERNGQSNRIGPISVKAGGFDWRHGLVLGGLVAAVLVLWVRGSRSAAARRGPDSERI